jgi:hypothetical protein
MMSEFTNIEAHQLIWNAYKNNRITIKFDMKHIARKGSPAWRSVDLHLPILVLSTFSLFILFKYGVLYWTTFLTLLNIYQAYLAPTVVRFLAYQRVLVAIAQANNFAIMWRYGGLSLILRDNDHISCISPTGNWKKFALLNLIEIESEPDLDNETIAIEENQQIPELVNNER